MSGDPIRPFFRAPDVELVVEVGRRLAERGDHHAVQAQRGLAYDLM